jgi:hypothetical protein
MSLDDFAHAIETLLNMEMESIQDNDDTWYEFCDVQACLTLGEHDFELDRDMHFGDYRYHLSIRALNNGNGEERDWWRYALAYRVYSALKAEDKYPLMLTDDLQVKLEEHHPKKSAVVPVAAND